MINLKTEDIHYLRIKLSTLKAKKLVQVKVKLFYEKLSGSQYCTNKVSEDKKLSPQPSSTFLENVFN